MIGRVCALGLLSVGMAMGQAPPAAKETAPAKALSFDVVSIRQNMSPRGPEMPPQFGPTPDGYRTTNMPLALVVVTAFPRQAAGTIFDPDRVTGLPDWAKQDRFDIDAKVAEEDLPEWQKPASQSAMLPAMLQALLADRCKIVVHREMKDLPVYLLVVGKNGPKFKETNPAEPHPAGITLPGGAIIVPSEKGTSMYGTSMGMLATVLTSMGKMVRPIQDKTGLSGRYDIVIPRPDMGPPPTAEGGRPAFDPSDMIFSAVEALGLKLESGKSSVETLVVDHIERPTAN